MTVSNIVRRSAANGCTSETGRLRKVVMCPPTYFQIVKPINVTQWLYFSDGLPRPNPLVMVKQHEQFVQTLRDEGVEVELVDPVRCLPYQHATRDVGAVVGDTIVLSSMREESRRAESAVTRPVLERYGLRVLAPERGFVEGGDVFVDGKRIWVGLGSRTDEWGVEFLYQTFGREFEVIPLRFGPIHTHLDTVFGIVGEHALVYEPAFEAEALGKIRAGFEDIVALTDKEQLSAGANVLSLGPRRVLGTKENPSVNGKLRSLGYEVVEIAFSEVLKTGGSVRCDVLPVERDSTS